jgi:hypothetical protein
MMVLSGGMMGFAFVLTTVLAWLGVAFLELFLVMGVTLFRDAKVGSPASGASRLNK